MWDFLYFDENGNAKVTRNANPFFRLDRAFRVPELPAKWERDGDGFAFFVEYDGRRWDCDDGTISAPKEELPKTISKLDLLLVLRELGKLDAFFAWLDASSLKPFWDAAQNMATDHPLYTQALASVQAALGISDEERDAILERIAK